jgi:hypothetical protein
MRCASRRLSRKIRADCAAAKCTYTVMQNLLDLSSLSSTRGRGGGGGSYAGAMGAFGLLAALFTQSSLNASGSVKIIVYGLLVEVARRVFQWLYARVLIRTCCS